VRWSWRTMQVRPLSLHLRIPGKRMSQIPTRLFWSAGPLFI
jgi:hypothetical protein